MPTPAEDKKHRVIIIFKYIRFFFFKISIINKKRDIAAPPLIELEIILYYHYQLLQMYNDR